MKVMVQEVENEGLEALMGKVVTLFCGIYIYTGKLVGVNDRCVKLSKAGIVYETGPFNENKWKDMQPLPNGEWYVTTSSIESFGLLK